MNWPELYPVVDCEYYDPEECQCTADDFYNEVCTAEETVEADCWWWEYTSNPMKTGLCSNQTEELLKDQENCIQPVWSQDTKIKNTIQLLVNNMCKQYNTYPEENFVPTPVGNNTRNYKNKTIGDDIII